MSNQNKIFVKKLSGFILFLIVALPVLHVTGDTAKAEMIFRQHTRIAAKKEVSGRGINKIKSAARDAINTDKKTVISPGKTDTPEMRKKRNRNTEKPTVKKIKEIDNIVPRKKKGISLLNALAFDVFIPGGGHLLYTDNYYWGIFFATMKIAGAYSIYYFYREWRYYHSLYQASKRANQEIDPAHELEFKDPQGGFKTEEEYRWEYDRSVQKLTLAVIVNIAIYVASCAVLYNSVKKYNQRTIPTFDVQYSSLFQDGIYEDQVQASCTLRM